MIRRKTGIRLKAGNLQFLMHIEQRDQAIKHLIGPPNWTVLGLSNSSPFPIPTQPTTRHKILAAGVGFSASGSRLKPKALVPGSELECCSSHLIPSHQHGSLFLLASQWGRGSGTGLNLQTEPHFNESHLSTCGSTGNYAIR